MDLSAWRIEWSEEGYKATLTQAPSGVEVWVIRTGTAMVCRKSASVSAALFDG